MVLDNRGQSFLDHHRSHLDLVLSPGILLLEVRGTPRLGVSVGKDFASSTIL